MKYLDINGLSYYVSNLPKYKNNTLSIGEIKSSFSQQSEPQIQFHNSSDSARIFFGKKGPDEAFLSIDTADNGAEAIMLRQFDDDSCLGDFSKMDLTKIAAIAYLLDSEHNTRFPQIVYAYDFIAKKEKETISYINLNDEISYEKINEIISLLNNKI